MVVSSSPLQQRRSVVRPDVASSSKNKTTTRTPMKRRVRRNPHNNASETTLLGAAILAIVGLSALTVSLAWALYQTKFRTNETETTIQQKSSSNFENTDDGRDILPFNPIYTVPNSFPTVGDRSDEYVTLRREIDELLPPDDAARSLEFLQRTQQQRTMMFDVAHSDAIPYDIYDCPDTPPPQYPYAWNLLSDVLDHWKVNDMNVPDSIHQGLCVFDYEHDYDKAIVYRNAELPFLVVNDPHIAATAERWNQPNYMERLLGDTPHRTEYSENNHFMYFIPPPHKKKRGIRRPPKIPEGWTEPTKLLRMPYAEWLRHANTTRPVTPDEEHWYYRLIGCGEQGECDQGSSEYLFDELPFFQPKESLYIVEPEEQKGIHCRFGMSGVIAENHFDASRNSIVVLSGRRRYILSHPNQCRNLALYPKGHPSARHSAVDWTNPDLTEFPDFAEAQANEVVLSAGQALYLPTDWFHFIVSLELNFQCNTRSGITDHYTADIARCGF